MAARMLLLALIAAPMQLSVKGLPIRAVNVDTSDITSSSGTMTSTTTPAVVGTPEPDVQLLARYHCSDPSGCRYKNDPHPTAEPATPTSTHVRTHTQIASTRHTAGPTTSTKVAPHITSSTSTPKSVRPTTSTSTTAQEAPQSHIGHGPVMMPDDEENTTTATTSAHRRPTASPTPSAQTTYYWTSYGTYTKATTWYTTYTYWPSSSARRATSAHATASGHHTSTGHASPTSRAMPGKATPAPTSRASSLV